LVSWRFLVAVRVSISHIAARPRALRMLDKETGTKGLSVLRKCEACRRHCRCHSTLSGNVGTSRPEEQILEETTRSDAHPKEAHIAAGRGTSNSAKTNLGQSILPISGAGYPFSLD
jgi:hypothetical protein